MLLLYASVKIVPITPYLIKKPEQREIEAWFTYDNFQK